MKISSDPLSHRQREQQVMQHVERLLADERLRLDTALGRRPVTAFTREVNRSDKAVDLRRLMSEMNLPDRELQSRMPIGESLDVGLSRTRLLFFKQQVGRLRVICISPTRALLAGEDPEPMTTGELQRVLGAQPPAPNGAPSTVVVVSTSGFTMEAHELAERRAERTVVLIEPNAAGGWTTIGPIETKALNDLFDPEAEQEKRDRVRAQIEQEKLELLTSGVATDKLAAKTNLPMPLVEAELKAYAKSHPGLVAKRIEGRVVLFREGASIASSPGRVDSGGPVMPLIERMKALFGRKGETEKKISFLAERRTALSQQRDRSYEDMGTLEQQEAQLKRQFGEATGSITKRRVTSQMLQLRKELERRQQLLTVLNQQINVVSTHLHNLELVQQGQTAKLPDTEEITADAVKAEEMLAQLEADSELASSVGQSGTAGLSEEEQALFEELERETGPKAEPAQASGATATQRTTPQASTTTQREAGAQRTTPSGAATPRRSEPEAG